MNRAVFLDRDNTLIEDPGYLSDPAGVKLLPGVELALKSLAQEGYKLIVVTNQSGIARGLLTEETLEQVHAELRRQLAERAVHLDAIYFCPFHPEGSIERYTCESDLRKPQPGMLLQGAHEFGLDLPQCWMVGDGSRDVEAGQRAGCRTIRIRPRSEHRPPGDEDSETAQADYTVRNLVEAARTILRAAPRVRPAAAAPAPVVAPAAQAVSPAPAVRGAPPSRLREAGVIDAPPADADDIHAAEYVTPAARAREGAAPVARASQTAAPAGETRETDPLPADARETAAPLGRAMDSDAPAAREVVSAPPAGDADGSEAPFDSSRPADDPPDASAAARFEADSAEVHQEMLRYLRQIARAEQSQDFSFVKLFGTLVQAVAFIALVIVLAHIVRGQVEEAKVWGLVTIALQLIALTMFTLGKR